MHVAVNLLAPAAYADRFRMFAALSDRCAALYLLVDALPEPLRAVAEAHPRLEVIELGPRRFARRACDWLHRRLDGPGLDVVHDTFGHLAEVFQAHGPRPARRARLVTTLYTSNHAWFTRVRHRGMDLGRRYVAQRIISLWRDLRVCSAADRVVVLGPGHEPDVAPLGVPPARVRWLPSEIDLDAFSPGAPSTVDPADTDRTAGPLVLYTGTVWRNKGVDLLLAVLPTLRDRWPRLQLHLVGNVVPWERAWLGAQLARSPMRGAIHAPGRVPRETLVDLYRRADLFVFPSLFEGSPRSVREAVACGCRAVVSDIPGCRGIDPGGDYLMFTPAGDHRAWRRAITDGLSEPPTDARRRIERGLEHIRAHHTPAAVAARYVELYGELLAEPPRLA